MTRRRQSGRPRWWLFFLFLGLPLGACAPAYPLYAPLQLAHSHGYAEERKGPAQFRVSYLAEPVYSYGAGRARRDAEADERLALAYDMALWRASELALRNGYPAFSVVDRANDLRVDYGYDDPFEDPFYGPCGDPYLFHRFGCRPFFYGYPGAARRYARIEARVSLTIELAQAIRPGLFAAQDAIAKLRARYPTALPSARPPG